MPSPTRSLAAAAVSLLLVSASACDPQPEAPPDAAELTTPDAAQPRIGTFASGRRLNTNHVGNHFFSEFDLTGATHQDTRLVQVIYAGTTDVLTDSLHVVDGELRGVAADGTVLHHAHFDATVWIMESDEIDPWGYPITVTTTLHVETGWDAPSNTPLYTFSYETGTSEQEVYTCPLAGQGSELTAAVFDNLHVDEFSGAMSDRPNTLYIGCIAGATGKAATWHYKPYQLQASYGLDLGLRLFEASVRMVRADYCGDGQSWTQPGTPLYIDDKLGANAAIPVAALWGQPMPVSEAVWGLNGALCLDDPRVHGTIISCGNGAWLWPCWGGAAALYADPNAGAWFRTASDP